MKKHLLIITPFFAPQSHASVYRMYKLAKYLPELGWEIHVLTVDTNYMFPENQKLLEALPPQVHVETSRYIEPTLRGLRVALGLKHRNKETTQNNHSTARTLPGQYGLWDKTYDYLLKRWVQVPDAYWTWARTALPKARALVREHKIPFVLTSSYPYSTLEIGYELQKEEGVRWIADFRDQMTYDHRLFSTYPSVFGKQRAIEKLAIDHASAITTLTSAGPMILADLYDEKRIGSIHFIPTGMDMTLAPTAASNSDPPYLLFTGSYLKNYGDEFFRIFKSTLDFPEIRKMGIKIKIAGDDQVNRPILEPIFTRLGIQDSIEFLGNLDQVSLYKVLRGAKAGVLPYSRAYGWWICAAKLVDYIALKIPVLALVPNPSEARKWLTLSNTGIFLDGTGEESARILVDFLLKPPVKIANEEVCRMFTATHQAKAFESLFASIHESATKNGKG